MTTNQVPDDAQVISDRFLDLIKPQRRSDRVTEDAAFVAMMLRMIRALEARTIENPENLPQVLALGQRLNEVVSVAIAANAERYQIDPKMGASMAECARILGMTKQSASERKARGVAIMGDRIDRAGAIRFAEAKRERDVIEAAHETAVRALADFRARKVA